MHIYLLMLNVYTVLARATMLNGIRVERQQAVPQGPNCDEVCKEINNSNCVCGPNGLENNTLSPEEEQDLEDLNKEIDCLENCTQNGDNMKQEGNYGNQNYSSISGSPIGQIQRPGGQMPSQTGQSSQISSAIGDINSPGVGNNGQPTNSINPNPQQLSDEGSNFNNGNGYFRSVISVKTVHPFRPPPIYTPPVPERPIITVRDKITTVFTSLITSFITPPPMVVTQAPVTITYTKREKPIVTTLPPLVFQIPTTIFKTAKPEIIEKTLPPQIIYQPPVTSTVHHQIEYPPSTVFISTTMPPVFTTVMVPGPVQTVSLPPTTITRVSTSVLPRSTVVVEKPSIPSTIVMPVIVTKTAQLPPQTVKIPFPVTVTQQAPRQPPETVTVPVQVTVVKEAPRQPTETVSIPVTIIESGPTPPASTITQTLIQTVNAQQSNYPSSNQQVSQQMPQQIQQPGYSNSNQQMPQTSFDLSPSSSPNQSSPGFSPNQSYPSSSPNQSYLSSSPSSGYQQGQENLSGSSPYGDYSSNVCDCNQSNQNQFAGCDCSKQNKSSPKPKYLFQPKQQMNCDCEQMMSSYDYYQTCDCQNTLKSTSQRPKQSYKPMISHLQKPQPKMIDYTENDDCDCGSFENIQDCDCNMKKSKPLKKPAPKLIKQEQQCDCEEPKANPRSQQQDCDCLVPRLKPRLRPIQKPKPKPVTKVQKPTVKPTPKPKPVQQPCECGEMSAQTSNSKSTCDCASSTAKPVKPKKLPSVKMKNRPTANMKEEPCGDSCDEGNKKVFEIPVEALSNDFTLEKINTCQTNPDSDECAGQNVSSLSIQKYPDVVDFSENEDLNLPIDERKQDDKRDDVDSENGSNEKRKDTNLKSSLVDSGRVGSRLVYGPNWNEMAD